MRIVIAGGTGQIGTGLTGLLAGSGHDCIVLSRRPRPEAAGGRIKYLGWDGQTLTGWESALDGADAVINLAGENIGDQPWTKTRLESIRSSRVRAGMALVEAVHRAARRPAVFLQASAVGYYGTERDAALDESSGPGDDLLAGICLAWEDSTLPVEGLGVRRIILRTGLVLEKERGILPKMMLPFKLFVGGPIGSGRQVLSWIHMEDELAAIKYLLEQPSTKGAFNLTAPNPATNAEFGRKLAGVLRRPYWAPVPAFALKLALGRQSKLVLEGQNVVPGRLLAAGFRFRHPDLDGALRHLLA